MAPLAETRGPEDFRNAFVMRRAIVAPAQFYVSGTKNKKVHKNEPI